MYTIVVGILGFILALTFISFLSYLHPALGVGGGILVFLCLIISFFPSEQENLIKDTKTNYEQLFDTANKSLINNGGISETLYNQMKVHNLKTEKIKEDHKTKCLNFKKKDYIFDLSQYPILKEEPTTELTTEPITTTEDHNQYVIIDGKRYQVMDD